MRILEVTIPVEDISAAVSFFTAQLGFRLHYAGSREAHLQAGYSRLRLQKADAPQPPMHIAFLIPAGAVDDTAAWAQNALSTLPAAEGQLIAEFPAWQARAMYFTDPSGNILECIGRFPLLEPEGQASKMPPILGISEAAIVVDDLPGCIGQLYEQASLTPFERQPVMPQFAALGNDEGLIIAIPPGRAWYPTADRHSGYQQMEILCDVNGSAVRIVNSRGTCLVEQS